MYEEHRIVDPWRGHKYPHSIYHNEPTLKVCGTPNIKRIDAPPKVTGTAKFANDQNLPNKLYLLFKRCPHSHAKVTSIDTTKAKAMPGVVMVLTHEDIPDMMASSPWTPYLHEECYVEGDEVAVVAAEEFDIAEEAIAQIDVEYEVLPFILDPVAALEPNAYIVHGDSNLERENFFTHTRGDVDAGFDEADEIIEDNYDSMSRDHGDLEGENNTVFWDGEILTSWTCMKNVYSDQATLASRLNLPINKVRIAPGYQSVNFGSGKGSFLKGEVVAGYVSMHTHRPVKFRGLTEGKFNATGNQTDQHHQIKVGVKNDGTLTAISDYTINNSGAYGSRSSNDCHTVVRAIYECPNLYLEGKDAYTNTPRVTSVRCVHHPHPTHNINVHMDKVAEAVDMNPADFLLKNMNYRSGHGTDQDFPEWDVGSNPMPEMFEDVLASSGWYSKWKGWGTPLSVNGSKKRGIGIAINSDRHGYLADPQSAHIVACDDGTFSLSCGSPDVGQGARTTLPLIAAEELGVSADRVRMTKVDTLTTQESRGPSGSTVTRGSGTAVILAARDVKEQLFKLAIAGGDIEANSPEELETADGFIYLKSDPEVKVEIDDVIGSQGSSYIDADGASGMIIGRGSYATNRINWMHRQWCTTVAEVEVDVDTGEVSVINAWHQSDIGRVIWLTGCISQVQGGLVHGQSRALFEEQIKDEATGVTLNPNNLDYKLVTFMDTANYGDLGFYEAIDPYGPLGAKGLGEPCVGAFSPAISNAIYNACGARINNPPMTPDSVLQALGKV